MDTTKIQLSEDELLLMQNSHWILTKNSIIDKIGRGFGDLANRMQQETFDQMAVEYDPVIWGNPKISKGEKYQALPYVILDYPRIFGKSDILAVRTLFWWGNYCSITLHLKGLWKDKILQNSLHGFHLLPEGMYISYSGDEWSHNLYEACYTLLEQVPGEQLQIKLPSADFLKLTAKVEIGSWSIMEQKLFDVFLSFVKLIQT